MSRTVACSRTKATGLRSWMRTARRSGQTRETEASYTQSMANRRRRGAWRGAEKMLRSKSPAKMRSTLERWVYCRPPMVSEPASWDSAKRGSVTTNWRTFRAAMAVETPTTPRAASESQRRHRKPAGFWVARAMSVYLPEFVEELFAGLPDVAGAQSEDGVT